MPNRCISTDISASDKIAALSPQAGFLFFMMIPHFNHFGKMNGNPTFIKGEVCPKVDWLTIENIPGLLDEISAKTNIKWFQHNGLWYLHSLNWTQHQPGLKSAAYRSRDYLPDYQPEALPKAFQHNSLEKPSDHNSEANTSLSLAPRINEPSLNPIIQDARLNSRALEVESESESESESEKEKERDPKGKGKPKTVYSSLPEEELDPELIKTQDQIQNRKNLLNQQLEQLKAKGLA